MSDTTTLPGLFKNLSHRLIKADSNGIDYNVWIATPPGYEQSEDLYPMVVVLDGEFFIGSALETVALQSSIGESKPVIVVGVSTAPPGVHAIQRNIDYSAEVPSEASMRVPPGKEFSFWKLIETMIEAGGLKFEEGFGGTDQFHSFLSDQLLEQLKADYRIDPKEIGLAGHSSGGDFAVDTLLRKQTPFSKFIVGSYGIDVLERRLPEREAAFAEMPAMAPLRQSLNRNNSQILPNTPIEIPNSSPVSEKKCQYQIFGPLLRLSFLSNSAIFSLTHFQVIHKLQ
ncbi:alpha/beta hydrolase [Pseudomaricurvus alkylphenolicus]|uniref:alpha/beta hydrolase n=1 Tax=Pseudomaricurvus alkylphenolicus TaxID=1306991 RepID=UPI00141F28CA|nr:alpha/beta hydrolase-fold protein [Pseudomaricurvus alkylphenolicus]NIB42439.1 alpha/beta hydrolase [Pseudomaricurvus alkylphenolicus]